MPAAGFEMSDVGLDRADDQRFARRAVRVRSRRRAPRPRSDRQAACRCRAPRCSRTSRGVHAPRFAAPRGCTASCDGPFGAVSPLLGPSWLTAEPRISADDPVAVCDRVRQPLEHDDAAAFACARSRRRTRRTSCSGRPAPASATSRTTMEFSGEQDQLNTAGQRQIRTRRCAGSDTRGARPTSEDEHAVSIEILGPWSPSTYEMRPDATLCATPEAEYGTDPSGVIGAEPQREKSIPQESEEDAGRALPLRRSGRDAAVLECFPHHSRAGAAAADPCRPLHAAQCRTTADRTDRPRRGTRPSASTTGRAPPDQDRRTPRAASDRRAPRGRHRRRRAAGAKLSGLSAPPGKRQPIPRSAIGSVFARSTASSFAFMSSSARKARFSGDSSFGVLIP